MPGAIRLLLALLAAGVLAALLPLGLLASENPDRFLQALQRQWQFGALVFVLPAVANAAVGFAAGHRRSWALLPLSLAVPAVAVVAAVGEAKGPLVIGLSLVPAGIVWLAGRLGQAARGGAKAGPAEPSAAADPARDIASPDS